MVEIALMRQRVSDFLKSSNIGRKVNKSSPIGFFRPKSRRLLRKWRAYFLYKKVALGDARASRGKSPVLRIPVRGAHTSDIGFRQFRCLGKKIQLQDANQNSIGRRLFPCVLLAPPFASRFLAVFPVFLERGQAASAPTVSLKTTERKSNVRFFALLLQVVQSGPDVTTKESRRGWAPFRSKRAACVFPSVRVVGGKSRLPLFRVHDIHTSDSGFR